MLTKDNLLFFFLGMLLMGILTLKHCGKSHNLSESNYNLQKRYDSLFQESENLKTIVKSLEAQKQEVYHKQERAVKEYKALPKAKRLEKIAELDSTIEIKGDSGAYLPITAIDTINQIVIDNKFTHEQLALSDSITQVQKADLKANSKMLSIKSNEVISLKRKLITYKIIGIGLAILTTVIIIK